MRKKANQFETWIKSKRVDRLNQGERARAILYWRRKVATANGGYNETLSLINPLPIGLFLDCVDRRYNH